MFIRILFISAFTFFSLSNSYAQLPSKLTVDVDTTLSFGAGFFVPPKTTLYINFEVKNRLKSDTTILININDEELARLYVYENQKLLYVSQAGSRVPIPERSVIIDANLIKIILKGGEHKRFVLAIDNFLNIERVVNPKFWNEESYQIFKAKQHEAFYYKYWLPFFFTLLVLALFLALIQYFILPERVFIYYFFYVLFTLIRSASALEIITLETWFPLLYKIGYRSIQSQVFTYLSFIFYVLFIREFTNFKLKKPKLDIFFKIQLAYLALFIIFDLLFTSDKYYNPQINLIFRSLEGLGLLFGLVTLILLFKVYDSLNKYIFFGALSLLIIALLGQEILKRSVDSNENTELNSTILSTIWGVAYLVEIAFFIAGLIFKQKGLLKSIDIQQKQNDLLLEQLASKNTEFENERSSNYSTFSLPTNQGTLVFQQSDIVRLEASGSYTIFSLQSQKQTLGSYTLSEFEHKLNPSKFVRVHKSHIINLLYVVKYTKGDGGLLTLLDGSVIPVSRSRKEELLKKLESIK